LTASLGGDTVRRLSSEGEGAGQCHVTYPVFLVYE